MSKFDFKYLSFREFLQEDPPRVQEEGSNRDYRGGRREDLPKVHRA